MMTIVLAASDISELPLWKVFTASYTDHLLRYLLIGGLTFLFFYAWRRRRSWAPKIQPDYPTAKEMRREFFYSLISIGIFALTTVGVVVLKHFGFTRVYYHAGAYGWSYLAVSTLVLIFAHDAYFYWTHRLMHWRPLFPLVHRIHHLSHTPTPWAAFAFHPIEAVIQAAFFPIIAFVMPVHPLAALLWLLYMTVMNVLGHCGFEILPRGFANHWLSKWHNTTTHHDMHHRYVRTNYGLYFNLWDRLMGTNHSRYEAEFEQVKRQDAAVTESPAPESCKVV
jgi:sterol desaturase/sphingolipid hydroxylase (fatty acid hydroxylase superfamily)